MDTLQRTRSDIVWSEARSALLCHLFPFYGTEWCCDQFTLPPLSIINVQIPDRRPGRHNQSGQCSRVGSGWRVRGDPGISLLLLLLLGSDRRAVAGLTFSPHSEREAAVTTVQSAWPPPPTSPATTWPRPSAGPASPSRPASPASPDQSDECTVYIPCRPSVGSRL